MFRMRNIVRLALALTAAAIALQGRAAHADLRFTNQSESTIYVAMGWRDMAYCGEWGGWRAAGWYPVQKGETTTVWYGNCASMNRYWYYYAESADGSAKWEGDVPFTVSATSAFDICDGGTLGGDTYYFRGFDVGSHRDFTMSLY
jgi:uncharacterized membrane protein